MKQKICPVDVISVCSASGELRPLRLQLEDEEHQLLRIDIDEVVSVKEVPYVGVEVSAANSLEECWDLVNVSEATGRRNGCLN